MTARTGRAIELSSQTVLPSSFSDRLLEAIADKGNPCVVGLDHHRNGMPAFLRQELAGSSTEARRKDAVLGFFKRIVDQVAPLVPAVKPQAALLEPLGPAGAEILRDIVAYSRSAGLLVIVDAKRGDIASSAEGYAEAFLDGQEDVDPWSGYNADAVTVTGFLGRDTLAPFIAKCKGQGKGLFVLVKTSNPGSVETQDVVLRDTGTSYSALLARMVSELGSDLIGSAGYSSIGAVVGATFPTQAVELRSTMPHAVILVPGYGMQGATADDAALCFNGDGRGAIVNASRSITHSRNVADLSAVEYGMAVRENALRMVDDIAGAVQRRSKKAG